MREKYALEAQGDCLGNLVPPGTVLVAEPGAELQPWDLVLIVFDPASSGPWATFGKKIAGDGHSAVAKIFLAAFQVEGETMGLFGQLNPPAIMPIPMSAVLAVDRLDFHGECTGDDLEALAMLKPFAMANLQQKEAAHAV